MLSEPIASYQTILAEQKAHGILLVLNWTFSHPLKALAIIIIIVFLLKHTFIPLFIDFLKKQKITKAGSIEYTPSEHLPEEISAKEIRQKRISIMPAPYPDPNSKIKVLPSELEGLINQIENGQQGNRTQCCVYCKNLAQAKALSILFYHRIKEVSAIDHHGWLCYKKQYDEPLNIQNCFFHSLRIFNAVNDRENRFIRQIDFFCKENQHTLLVFYMHQDPDENDDRFEQLNALPGLSIILFSDKTIPGFQTCYIKKKGGNTCE